MNYPLDEELKSIASVKMPNNIKLLPVMNMIMNVFKCKPDKNVDVTKCEIPGFEGATLKAYVIEPKHAEGKLPCMVYFHGGGFMLKASGAHYELAKEYAAKLPCKVVYVDYRLAPKYPFPIPVEDCFATYKWVIDNAEKLGIQSTDIMIAGDSAGGNLSTAVTLMARDRGLAMPSALLLVYPVTDRRMTTASMKKYTDTPVWDANLSKTMWSVYLGEQRPEHIEYASPLEAPTFEKFPPTYIEVAEFDSLHDEGVLLYDRLIEEGIPAELHEMKAACHGFENALESKMVRKCMERRISWLQKAVPERNAGEKNIKIH